MSESTRSQTDAIPSEYSRYTKQIRFPGMGLEGQRHLAESRTVIIGCGALGSVSANLMVRAGVGEILIIDRDFVELDNLQRQVLFDESDVGLPKAIVAAKKLKAINSQIKIAAEVADVDFRNIDGFLMQPRPADVVLDGTDNFEVRFLINDACVQRSMPWIYGGCLGAEGQVMAIVPGESACLNCLMMDGPPPPGTTATCDSGGILSTIIQVVAAYQSNEALKILSSNRAHVSQQLHVFDLWGNRSHAIDLSQLKGEVDCPTCRQRQFDWLTGVRGSQSVVLCGRNAVQVSFPDRNSIDLKHLADRWQPLGHVQDNPYLVRLDTDQFVITAFRDGRAIIQGTEDISVAKKLYAQFIGA